VLDRLLQAPIIGAIDSNPSELEVPEIPDIPEDLLPPIDNRLQNPTQTGKYIRPERL